MKQTNKKTEEITGVGVATGIYCTPNEFRDLIEIIKEVKNTSMIQVSGNAGVGIVKTKLIKTQQDIFIKVAKLAEKHKLPLGFYGINQNREFIHLIQGREDDFHNIYSL